MSTQVATPATTIEPTGVTSAVTEPTAALVEAEAPPAAVAPAVESHDDAAAATSSPAHGKKRSPFGDLKNKLFHKVSSLSTRDWARTLRWHAISRTNPARTPPGSPACPGPGMTDRDRLSVAVEPLCSLPPALSSAAPPTRLWSHARRDVFRFHARLWRRGLGPRSSENAARPRAGSQATQATYLLDNEQDCRPTPPRCHLLAIAALLETASDETWMRLRPTRHRRLPILIALEGSPLSLSLSSHSPPRRPAPKVTSTQLPPRRLVRTLPHHLASAPPH